MKVRSDIVIQWQKTIEKNMIQKILQYIESLFKDRPKFTGRLILDFKDGQLMQIEEFKRTKFTE